MKDTTSMFWIGAVVAVLVIKPSVGSALFKAMGEGISTVATALNETPKEIIIREKIIKEETPEDLGNGRIIDLLTMIYDKLDTEPIVEKKVYEND